MINDRIEQNLIRATYRITTPLFCGGAEQRAEFRLPSFKGVLRFWWRTLEWGEVRDADELRKQEAAIFGASDESIGQSQVRLRLAECQFANPVSDGQVLENGKLSGAHYLGYGVMVAQSGQLNRPMIPSGTFQVVCLLSPKLTSKQRESIANALILVGTVGGIGSKSRKGYGSLTLTELSIAGVKTPLSTSVSERLEGVLGKLDANRPEWSAWSQQSRIVTVSANGESAIQLLDMLGRELVFFRSWGRQGRVLGEKSEENFPLDHHLSKGQSVEIGYPARVAFGLPHNYGTGSQAEVAPASKQLDRRASPLFLHIHQMSDSSPPTGVVTFLPSRFLPAGEQIRAFNRNRSMDSSDAFWEPIHGYLNRLVAAPGATAKKTSLMGQEVTL